MIKIIKQGTKEFNITCPYCGCEFIYGLDDLKRGTCCIKTEEGWKIDKEIPVFTEDRNYIERLI